MKNEESKTEAAAKSTPAKLDGNPESSTSQDRKILRAARRFTTEEQKGDIKSSEENRPKFILASNFGATTADNSE